MKIYLIICTKNYGDKFCCPHISIRIENEKVVAKSFTEKLQ